MAGLLSYFRIPFYATSFLAFSASGLLWWKQNEIIYPRSIPPDARTNIPTPSEFQMHDYESLHLPTRDGEKVHAYLIRPSNRAQRSNTTILMFHGNAGNIGHRLPIADILEKSMGCNVVMLEYRGYGSSTGDPEEKGLMIDAQTGLDWIRNQEELRNTKIVIYGQSLGGAVGIQLVARNQDQGDIKALLLENTFLSIKKMIPVAFPPAKYLAPLCTQVWPSESTIPQLRVPILFLSGAQDEIIPPFHMKTLHDLAAASPKKQFKIFPGGTHNDTVACHGYFDTVVEFLGSVLGFGSGRDSML